MTNHYSEDELVEQLAIDVFIKEINHCSWECQEVFQHFYDNYFGDRQSIFV